MRVPSGGSAALPEQAFTAARPDRLRIVHIAAPADVGGLERVVQALAVGQHRAGHDVRVIAAVEPSAEEHPFVRPLLAAGVAVHLVRLPGRAYLRERREVARVLRSSRPDVVHTHGYRPDLLHGGAARAEGIPVVSTLHGSSRLGGATHLYEWMQERLLHRFDAVIAVSNPLGDHLRGIGHSARLHVVPNAWAGPPSPMSRAEARRALGISREEVAIGWVGRLIVAKGADLFLQALARLRDLSLPWRAHLLGDGEERARLERMLDHLRLRGRVRLYGAVDEAGRLFPAFDAYALTSRTEGTPIVLFEAMAAGTPVAATRVGGVPDMVSEREARLAPPGDPVAMAEALREVLVDPAGAAARAERARRRLQEEFALEGWLERHEEIYRDVQRDRGRR